MSLSKPRRTWFGTLNNFTDDDVENFEDMGSNPDVKMVVCGKETCPTTGTPHLQFVCTLSRPIRLTAAKEFFGNRAYLDGIRGTIQEAITYCKKEGNIVIEKVTNAQGDLTINIDNGMEQYRGVYSVVEYVWDII